MTTYIQVEFVIMVANIIITPIFSEIWNVHIFQFHGLTFLAWGGGGGGGDHIPSLFRSNSITIVLSQCDLFLQINV